MSTGRASLKIRWIPRWFSDENLTKKAYLNAIASSLDYGVRLLVGFIVTPLLVAGLGNFGFGAWQILGRLIGYINPTGGRSAQALKWSIASRQTSTDYDGKRRLVGSAIVVWLLFLPLFISLGLTMAWFAPIWLDAPADEYKILRIAAAILVLALIMLAIVEVPRAVLIGENLGYKRMGLSALLVIVGGGLTVLALSLNTGLVGVAAAHLTTTVLTGFLFLGITRKQVSWFGIAKPSRKTVQGFLGLSGWFVVWGLIMRLMRGSDVVILGIFDSPELVTTFVLTSYVPEILTSGIAMLVFGVSPGIGGIIGSGNLRKAVRLRSEMMTFTWLVATVLGGTIMLWNHSFIGLWVGAEYYAGPTATLLILLSVMQFVLIRNDSNVIDLTLDLRRKVLIGLLSTVLSITTACVLVAFYDLGIIGLCLGFIFGRTILTFTYPWIVGRYLGITISAQLREIIRPGVVTLTSLVCMYYFGRLVIISSWTTLVPFAALTLAVTFIVSFYGGLSSSQRHRISKRVRAIVSTS